MTIAKLIIPLSDYDERIKDLVTPAIGALDKVAYKRYSRGQDLSGYEGDSKYPLTLVGHANELNFKTGIMEYTSGAEVAKTLIERGLKATTFQFCLLAGCRGAHLSKRDGLFVKVGDELGIPVVASTTSVSMGRVSSEITLTPIDEGGWRVYYPETSEIFNLGASRCSTIKDTLDSFAFKCKLGVP